MQLTSAQERLRFFTKQESLIAELLAYTQNAFCKGGENIGCRKFDNEPQISDWERYVSEAHHAGVYATLKKYWVQFQFPVKENISQTTDYRNATLKGFCTKKIEQATGLPLKEPQKLKLYIHPSAAGDIPVLIANNRSDFQTILRAMSYRNEPHPLPHAMGAAMIKGINNWDRFRRLKKSWKQKGGIYQNHRNSLIENRPHYQDNIILLGRTPYSNVAAKDMNLDAGKWLEHSLQIRLAHECAHYFTLRYFGKMANNMHDELLADYMGICAVLPYYDATWFLKFIGLGAYPAFRSSGRMKNYLGKPPLSPPAFEVLQTIVFQAAKHLEQFDKKVEPASGMLGQQQKMLALCSLGLLEMASPDGVALLLQKYQALQVAI